MAAFDRQIKAPDEVYSHIEFTETNPEDDVWGENREIVRLMGTPRWTTVELPMLYISCLRIPSMCSPVLPRL